MLQFTHIQLVLPTYATRYLLSCTPPLQVCAVSPHKVLKEITYCTLSTKFVIINIVFCLQVGVYVDLFCICHIDIAQNNHLV